MWTKIIPCDARAAYEAWNKEFAEYTASIEIRHDILACIAQILDPQQRTYQEFVCTQIAKTIRSTSIRHRSDTFMSDQYLI